MTTRSPAPFLPAPTNRSQRARAAFESRDSRPGQGESEVFDWGGGLVLTGMDWVGLGWTGFELGLTWLDWDGLGWTGMDWDLPGCTGMDRWGGKNKKQKSWKNLLNPLNTIQHVQEYYINLKYSLFSLALFTQL